MSGPQDNWIEEMRSADTERMQLSHSQIGLFPIRISSIFPSSQIGQHLSFTCMSGEGDVYYAKDDKDGFPIRATEWICTSLARHLGLSVAECAVLEDKNGYTYFGSRQPTSLADEIHCSRFLLTPHGKDEVGRPCGWIGAYLARLFAFDIFVNNPDRTLQNFVLDRDGRLRAIDFASSRLIGVPNTNFPIASDNTNIVGRAVRKIHGAHIESAFELLDWLGTTAASTIEAIARLMPDDWMTQDQMEGSVEVWSDGRNLERASRAKALIGHDWNI